MIALSRIFLLLCLILIASTGTSAQSSDCPSPDSQLLYTTFDSAILGQSMDYALYLPPCYSEQVESPYPVIYLLHGSNRSHEHWPSLGIQAALDRGIAGGAYPPVVVAMPFGTWIANENRFEGERTWSHILLTEFMPVIESGYAVRTDGDGRAIGGISRGGFWAYNIGLRLPDQFNAVGGHSAFFDPGHFPADYNPLDLAETAPGIDSLRLWLDRGTDDYAWYGLDLMHDTLTARGIDHTYQVYAQGEHTDDYWAGHIDDYLTFYTADWIANHVEDLPAINHAFDTSHADLFVPVVAFPTVEDDMTRERLLRLYSGQLDFDFIMSNSLEASLLGHGVTLNAETRRVTDDDLIDALWADPGTYTLMPLDTMTPQLRLMSIDGLHPLDIDLMTYPFVFHSDMPNYDASDVGRYLISGVTAIGRNTMTQIDVNGVEWAASGILDTVQSADVFHISSEVSFAPRCPQSDEPVIGGLCAKDDHFALFELLGVDLVELTGNHNLDYGDTAYLRTLDFYANAGMQTLGGGADLDAAREPVIFDLNGTTVGHLACNWNGPEYALATDTSPGAAYCNTEWLREGIPQLDAEADVVIVTIQYAEYNQYRPIQRQVGHFALLADLGADVVLGTQAHVPQAFSLQGETIIHYGLGNFFFDQTGPDFTRFFLDEILTYRGEIRSVYLYTGVIEDQARPRLMTAAERAAFLTTIFDNSDLAPVPAAGITESTVSGRHHDKRHLPRLFRRSGFTEASCSDIKKVPAMIVMTRCVLSQHPHEGNLPMMCR